MTQFGVHADRSVKQLTEDSVRAALSDASADAVALDAAFFANATQSSLEGQHMVGGQIALREMGIQGIPVVNVENACASGSSAFHLAVQYVKSGAADVLLAVGTEKMNIDDRRLTMKIFDGAYDVSSPEELEATLRHLGGDVDLPDGPRSIFMDIYAAMARNHMENFGTTQEQITAVATKNHQHSVENPRAHFRKSMTIDEILDARALAYPLTVPMCAPVTDGSSAAIVCSDRELKKLGSRDPVKVLATALATGSDRDTRQIESHVSGVAGATAFDQAAVGPHDVDVVEVHDATAFAEVLQLEVLGFVPPGEGGEVSTRGVTSIDGALPVNPSGGLQSKGHPLAATGLAQIFELTDQLRGRAGRRQVHNARIALAENGGGFHRGEEAVASVAILGGP